MRSAGRRRSAPGQLRKKRDAQHDQNEGGDGQDAVDGNDRAREVPFRRNPDHHGRRRVRGGIRAIDADPAGRHDQAKHDDDTQVGDRVPGQLLVVSDQVEAPRHQATDAQQRVGRDDRDGQPLGSRALELTVVLRLTVLVPRSLTLADWP
jgi:hypothetical protein